MTDTLKKEKNGWFRVTSFLLRISNAEKLHRELDALRVKIQVLEENSNQRIAELERRVEALENIVKQSKLGN